MSGTYRDFGWLTSCPANGAAGAGLADRLIGLISQLSDVRRLCDLGCGNGYLAGRLAALGYAVTAIDASPSGIELGRQNYPEVDFARASFDTDLARELNKCEFDLVISSDVIEHLYRPSDLIESATSLLKANGHLIVGTPYHGYLKNLTLSLLGRMDAHFSPLWDGGHIKFFSVKTLSALMTRHGFDDLQFTYYGRAPWLWKNMICHTRKRI